MKKELHLFIIWENARNKQNEILEDIKKNFKILNVYEVEWAKENFSNNLTRFYGTNLPAGSDKEVHCGNGKFLLIIIQDLNPKYEERDTSKGKKVVNINLFDKKTEYRNLTGGGHKIHSTNSETETNHDITLLLGKNVEDYLKYNGETKWNGKIEELKRDLTGCGVWKDAKEMFYVLNNCVNYAILRNYEGLPEEIYVNEHNDIDLICESMVETAYILNARSMHKEIFRVQHEANVGDRIAYFDLRNIGDNYYYKPLEERILKNREYNEKGFYVLNKEDYFYTLLYHAYVQKPEFKQDYKEKLMNMGVEKVTLNTSLEEYGEILQKWLLKNEYVVIEPVDRSVYFNKENLKDFKSSVYYENEAKERELSDLRECKDRLISENEKLKARNLELENTLSGIKDSRSWKIMEPLRKLMKNLK